LWMVRCAAPAAACCQAAPIPSKPAWRRSYPHATVVRNHLASQSPGRLVLRNEFSQLRQDCLLIPNLHLFIQLFNPCVDRLGAQAAGGENLDLLVISGPDAVAFGDQFFVKFLPGAKARDADLY